MPTPPYFIGCPRLPKVFHKMLPTLTASPFVPSSFLLLVAMPGAPSSVLAPSSKARICFMFCRASFPRKVVHTVGPKGPSPKLRAKKICCHEDLWKTFHSTTLETLNERLHSTRTSYHSTSTSLCFFCTQMVFELKAILFWTKLNLSSRQLSSPEVVER